MSSKGKAKAKSKASKAKGKAKAKPKVSKAKGKAKAKVLSKAKTKAAIKAKEKTKTPTKSKSKGKAKGKSSKAKSKGKGKSKKTVNPVDDEKEQEKSNKIMIYTEEDFINLPLRDYFRLDASNAPVNVFRALLAHEKDLGFVHDDYQVANWEEGEKKEKAIDEIVARIEGESFNKRTNIEKLLAEHHDIKSHDAQYIMVAAYALLEEENVNRGELHLTVSHVKEILNQGKNIELAFVDVETSTDNISAHAAKMQRDIEALIPKGDKKPYKNLRKSLRILSESNKYHISGFNAQTVCFKITHRSPTALMIIMGVLAKANENRLTKGAPASIFTFYVSEDGEEDDDIKGAHMNHNVTYLSYSS